MHSNFTKKFIGLKDIQVKKIISSDISLQITLETKPKLSICPCCGNSTSKIHDYRDQKSKTFLTWIKVLS